MYTSLKKQFRNKSAIVFYSGSLFLLITSYAFGATPEFVPLAGLPGLRNLDKNTSISTYINAIYLTIISIGALIGVVRLAIAGVKYSLDDIVTHKQEAKDDIKGVLLGLAILLIPFIVLNTIYPGLTNLDVLQSAPRLNLRGPQIDVNRVYNTAFENELAKSGDTRKAQEAGDAALNPNRREKFDNLCANAGRIVSPESTERHLICLPVASRTDAGKNCVTIYQGTWDGKNTCENPTIPIRSGTTTTP